MPGVVLALCGSYVKGCMYVNGPGRPTLDGNQMSDNGSLSLTNGIACRSKTFNLNLCFQQHCCGTKGVLCAPLFCSTLTRSISLGRARDCRSSTPMYQCELSSGVTAERAVRWM